MEASAIQHTPAPDELTARLKQPPATGDEFDIHSALDELLATVGMSSADAGGQVSFTGSDPIMPGTLRLAGATSIALVAKSVAVSSVWRQRGGEGQDISMDLRTAPRRLCPFYEGKWELLNGFPQKDPVMVSRAYATDSFYRTADDRWIHLMGPYAKLRQDHSRFLGVPEDPEAVKAAVSRWNFREIEDAGNEAGLVLAGCRTLEELMAERQYTEVLSFLPPVSVERIGDSAPEPFTEAISQPLEGLRVLGRAHIIAGAGVGRALALHGADVLNVWDPNEYEIPAMYTTSNVGMRSTTLDLHSDSGAQRMKKLLEGADVFFANRRTGYLERHGLDANTAAQVRPGIIHASVTLNGETGPWANRVGFDQTAGALAGVMLAEGQDVNGERVPGLPAVPVVNDYITAWFLELGILRALTLRARFGGSYKVTVSLTRVALWLQSLGTFDREYSADVAGREVGHELLAPNTFTAHTPLGLYQGVTEQVQMSRTPGYYTHPLMPRGSDRPAWESPQRATLLAR